MGWLVNITTSCSLVRSFGNVRGGNKSSVMGIKHNNIMSGDKRERWVGCGVGEVGGRGEGKRKRSTVKLTNNCLF